MNISRRKRHRTERVLSRLGLLSTPSVLSGFRGTSRPTYNNSEYANERAQVRRSLLVFFSLSGAFCFRFDLRESFRTRFDRNKKNERFERRLKTLKANYCGRVRLFDYVNKRPRFCFFFPSLLSSHKPFSSICPMFENVVSPRKFSRSQTLAPAKQTSSPFAGNDNQFPVSGPPNGGGGGQNTAVTRISGRPRTLFLFLRFFLFRPRKKKTTATQRLTPPDVRAPSINQSGRPAVAFSPRGRIILLCPSCSFILCFFFFLSFHCFPVDRQLTGTRRRTDRTRTSASFAVFARRLFDSTKSVPERRKT